MELTQNRNSVYFSTDLHQFCNIHETLLQIVSVFCNSSEYCRRSVKIKGFLFHFMFRYLQVGLSAVIALLQFAEDIDLISRNRSMEETRKLIFST